MKTYEIKTETGTHFIKTEAISENVQEAINFVQRGEERTIDKLLQALRLLGFKSVEIRTDALDLFEL